MKLRAYGGEQIVQRDNAGKRAAFPDDWQAPNAAIAHHAERVAHRGAFGERHELAAHDLADREAAGSRSLATVATTISRSVRIPTG